MLEDTYGDIAMFGRVFFGWQALFIFGLVPFGSLILRRSARSSRDRYEESCPPQPVPPLIIQAQQLRFCAVRCSRSLLGRRPMLQPSSLPKGPRQVTRRESAVSACFFTTCPACWNATPSSVRLCLGQAVVAAPAVAVSAAISYLRGFAGEEGC